MPLTKQQIEKRIAELDEIIDPLQAERGELKQQLLELKSAFVVGDIIRWKYGRKYRMGRVIEIRNWCCGDVMWSVVNIRKDGTEGNIIHVYAWQNPSCVEK